MYVLCMGGKKGRREREKEVREGVRRVMGGMSWLMKKKKKDEKEMMKVEIERRQADALCGQRAVVLKLNYCTQPN